MIHDSGTPCAQQCAQLRSLWRQGRFFRVVPRRGLHCQCATHQELKDPEDELDDELRSLTEVALAELLALGVASAASPCTALAPWRSAPRP
jgi:hypothetical protein